MSSESLNILVILVSATKKKEEAPNRCTSCCVLCYCIDWSCITLLMLPIIGLPILPVLSSPKEKTLSLHITHINENPNFIYPVLKNINCHWLYNPISCTAWT